MMESESGWAFSGFSAVRLTSARMSLSWAAIINPALGCFGNPMQNF